MSAEATDNIPDESADPLLVNARRAAERLQNHFEETGRDELAADAVAVTSNLRAAVEIDSDGRYREGSARQFVVAADAHLREIEAEVRGERSEVRDCRNLLIGVLEGSTDHSTLPEWLDRNPQAIIDDAPVSRSLDEVLHEALNAESVLDVHLRLDATSIQVTKRLLLGLGLCDPSNASRLLPASLRSQRIETIREVAFDGE